MNSYVFYFISQKYAREFNPELYDAPSIQYLGGLFKREHKTYVALII